MVQKLDKHGKFVDIIPYFYKVPLWITDDDQETVNLQICFYTGQISHDFPKTQMTKVQLPGIIIDNFQKSH